jgi:hypothetical protein
MPMLVLGAIVTAFWLIIATKADLAIENLALRQQPQRFRLGRCLGRPVATLILLRPAEYPGK